ncbi:sensor histidine kinase [Colwellia sp. MEBiC06753]
MKTNQLRRRIISYFVSIVVLLSLLFSLITLLFSYIIEDSFFYQILANEKHQVSVQLAQGEKPKPHFDFVAFHRTRESLPKIVQELLAEEPERIEFSGEAGKHYHIAFLDEQVRDQNILLAEVSEHLVVRKLKGQIFGFTLVLLAIGLVVALLLAFGTVRLIKKLMKPLDELMDIVDSSPVEKLPTNFAEQFQQNEIGKFAQTLEVALKRISAFVKREQQFTRDISHELRTPVTISQGALSLLRHTELDSRQQALVARIADADQQMQATLETLLALAREKSIEPEQTHLKSVVETCVINNHHLLQQTTLNIDVPDDVYVAMGGQELRLVIQNLLQNAAYHSQGSQVQISYQNSRLIIADNGSGFEINDQVFDAGIRGPKSKGQGLGLSLVKRLCEKFEVEVSLSSTEYGVKVVLAF